MNKIGITTTVTIEILLAAGYQPVDLNNVFITDPNPERLITIAELSRRRIDRVIHYVQAFCHRRIGDIIFRHTLKLPVLTLEGNDDFFLTHHLKTRVEAFLDMLQRSRRRVKIVEEV
jgi:benzoyl-CoA reductase/2-hydroxyglutaryl-CoA dehydratase subunit BcrC/BadD/HgdB